MVHNGEGCQALRRRTAARQQCQACWGLALVIHMDDGLGVSGQQPRQVLVRFGPRDALSGQSQSGNT